MVRPRGRWFTVRQICIAIGAAIAYFGVRGLTEGEVRAADRNARSLLDLERSVGLDIELGLQDIVRSSSVLTTAGNWVYIWLHWPLLIGTLAWLLRNDRLRYLSIRNAMMVSGVIGLVLFATFPVTPPRLLHQEYLDTVTEYSYSYRVLQPPMFMDRYAAFPSLHFGWNLLAGIAWARRSRKPVVRWAAIVMPIAMGVAVVTTANHWVVDVIGGGAVALVGQVVSDRWMRRRQAAAVTAPAHASEPTDRTRPTGRRRPGAADDRLAPRPPGHETPGGSPRAPRGRFAEHPSLTAGGRRPRVARAANRLDQGRADGRAVHSALIRVVLSSAARAAVPPARRPHS